MSPPPPGAGPLPATSQPLPPPPPLSRMPAYPPPPSRTASPSYNSGFAMEVAAAETSHPDPVLSFVDNMMGILSGFAHSYQAKASQPVHQPSGIQPARSLEPERPKQSKKPRLLSPEPSQASGLNLSSNQPAGRSLSPIQPSPGWLGETQEDLAQQLDQLDYNPSLDISIPDIEEGEKEPDETTNLNQRSVDRAWISAQISSQLNDFYDKVTAKVTKAEENSKKAMEQVESLTRTITKNEAKLTELSATNEALETEVTQLKLELTALRKKFSSLPTQPQGIMTANQTAKPSPVQNASTSQAVPPAHPATRNDEEPPPLPQPARPRQWAESWSATKPKPFSVPPAAGNQDHRTAKQKRIEEIIYRANSIIGLKPISKRRVEQFEHDSSIQHLPEKEKHESAKRMAVEEFLEKEMNMKEEEIKALPILKIFFPRYGDSKILYVQLSNPRARAIITTKSNVLQYNEDNPSNAPRIIKYVPAELYQRFKALESYTYQLRNNPTNPLDTNVRYGKDDFELRVRPAKNNEEYNADFKPDPWQYIVPTPLPDLPAINLDKDRRPAILPPGRTLTPTPPSCPLLPVPQEFLAMDDMDCDNETEAPTGSSSQQPASMTAADSKKRKNPTNEQLTLKPLPPRHSSFPPALSTERFLQSSSNSCEAEVPTTPAHIPSEETCQ